MQEISLNGYQTVKPLVLFYRDPLECIQALLRNPTYEGKWSFTARRVYENANRQSRVYGDWMSGDGAWSAQVSTLLTSLIYATLTLCSVYSPTGRNTPRHSPLF